MCVWLWVSGFVSVIERGFVYLCIRVRVKLRVYLCVNVGVCTCLHMISSMCAIVCAAEVHVWVSVGVWAFVCVDV